MSNAELLIERIKSLSEENVAVTLDFVGYLEQKAAKNHEVCPICAQYYDPRTGEPPYNAETRAAIEEGDAMIEGRIPAKWYNSLDEMWDDLTK